MQVGNRSVPYFGNMVDFCGHDENYTPTVRFTGQKALVLRSVTQHVHGGGSGGICEPIGHARQVRAEGSPVVRDRDLFWMDDRRTVGEATFVRDTACHPAPDDRDPIPGSGAALSDAVFRPGDADAAPPGGLLQKVQATITPDGVPFAAPPGQHAPPAAPTRQAPATTGPPGTPSGGPGPPPDESSGPGRWLRRINPFAEADAARRLLDPLTGNRISRYGVEYDLNDIATWQTTDDAERAIVQDGIDRIRREALPSGDRERSQEILEETRQRLIENERTRERRNAEITPLPGDNVRVTEQKRDRRCKVGPYSEMQDYCAAYGMQAHHIVPDSTLRYGTREESMAGINRIPGDTFPTFWSGPSICLIGNARSTTTEHGEGHVADEAIEALGQRPGTPLGTAPFDDVRDAALDGVLRVRPECTQEVSAAVETAFKGTSPRQLLRTTWPTTSQALEPLTRGDLATLH